MNLLRHCRECLTRKPTSEFYASSLRVCKACVCLRVSKYRAENIERIREYDRGRGFRGKPTLTADYKARYPQRRAAQNAINNAIRGKRVLPWPVCAMPTCDGKPEAHHPDYSSPLEVVWLCPAHHKQAHALVKKAA